MLLNPHFSPSRGWELVRFWAVTLQPEHISKAATVLDKCIHTLNYRVAIQISAGKALHAKRPEEQSPYPAVAQTNLARSGNRHRNHFVKELNAGLFVAAHPFHTFPMSYFIQGKLN